MINLFLKLFTSIAPDFQVMYIGANDVINKLNPYLNASLFTGNTNLPNSLIFYLPYLLFNYQTAQQMFIALSLICLVFAVIILLKIFGFKLRIAQILIIFLLTLFSFPAKFTLGMGQINFVTLFLLVGAFYLFKNKRDLLSGIILGILISYKIVFIYFLIYFLLKRERRLVLASIFTFLLFVLSTLVIYGSFDIYKYYFSNVLPPLSDFTNRGVVYNQGIAGFVSRVVSNIDLSKVVTILLIAILTTHNFIRVIGDKNRLRTFILTVLTFLLIDTFSWQHHFVLLLIPFIYLYKKVIKNKVLSLLLLLSYVLTSTDTFSILLNSNQFFGTLILFYLLQKTYKLKPI